MRYAKYDPISGRILEIINEPGEFTAPISEELVITFQQRPKMMLFYTVRNGEIVEISSQEVQTVINVATTAPVLKVWETWTDETLPDRSSAIAIATIIDHNFKIHSFLDTPIQKDVFVTDMSEDMRILCVLPEISTVSKKVVNDREYNVWTKSESLKLFKVPPHIFNKVVERELQNG